MKKVGVIVLGGHIQGLNIIRVYGKNGIPTILLDSTRFNLGKYSKYCSKFYRYKNENILDILLEFGKKGEYRGWLILPTNDFHVKILSQNRDELNRYFIVSSDRWSVVEKCYNKIETYKIAQLVSVPFPNTIFPKDINELISNSNIKYPCIIKPAVMHTFYSKFKKKVFLCRDKNELISNYILAIDVIPKSEIMVQDIIPGSSYNEYSSYFFYREGRVFNYMAVRRKRQHPADFGNAATFIESVEIEELRLQSEKLLKAINYSGICEVEFKYDSRDKKYKLLEINPRTWKSHVIAEEAGVPFLMSFYNKMVHNRDLITTTYRESYSKHILLDTIMIILNREYRADRFYDKKKTKYYVWDRDDILPALFELIYFPINIFKR